MVLRSISTMIAIAAATAAVSCGAQPLSRSPKGFYLTTGVIRSPAQLPSAQSIASPATQGVFVRVQWSSLEPERGRFDWRLIDPIVKQAVAANKKISIGLFAASRSPEWLASAGVQTASFKTKERGCTAITLPIPWDAKYIDAYLAAMGAIKDRLKLLGALDRVTIVKVSGIARSTLEMRLPVASRCGDNLPLWQSLGYRPSKLIGAWSQMAAGLDTLYPGRLLSVAILQGEGFPNIDDRGRTVSRSQSDMTGAIIALCIRRYGRRCAVQWNALKLNGALSDRVFDAARAGATIGWQTNLFEGARGAGCQPGREDATILCTPQTYQALLDRGVKTGATFIEVWDPDVQRFPTSLAAAARDWK